jgi:ubiquinone/menaquinone biosynthesis C-methylase UbiE
MTDKPSIFWEIHSGLPREGPGDNASTHRAYLLATELPSKPRILDIGSGPGMQTMELARSSNGTIVALDTHQPFLDELDRRAKEQGFSERIKTVNASMFELPFEKESFDLIWSEGAMYFMGFRNALNAWKEFLSPRGYIVGTEPSWLKTDIPEEVQAHWAEYPGMLPIEGTQKIIQECGFEEVGHFVLPEASWWDEYYNPKEQKLKMLREKYKDDPDASAQVEEAQKELDVHRKYGDLYGYVFFVMRKRS